MTLDIDHLRQWVGKSEVLAETLAPFPSNALAATLDRDDPVYGSGSALPPLWHWLHFLPVAPMSAVGPDGHPERGAFLPPVPLPRRMWAGSRLNFIKPLMIGETVTRTSTVKSVEHKAGRTGDLVFVTVRHVLSGASGVAIEEEHDIVYRGVAAPGTVAPLPVQASVNEDWSRVVHPDPVLLFRYSALTFNSHRIHYDQPYVTDVEGYPGLVVHGPLIATLLLDALRREKPDARVRSFTFKAVSPLFDVADFNVCGRMVDAGKAHLWARNSTGGLAMDATAEII